MRYRGFGCIMSSIIPYDFSDIFPIILPSFLIFIELLKGDISIHFIIVHYVHREMGAGSIQLCFRTLALESDLRFECWLPTSS